MWAEQSISGILEDKTYLGHTVIGKTVKPSYKSKLVKHLPQEQHKIFPDTHESLVDEETFNIVQKIRANKRRPAKVGGIEPFAVIVYCSDCGRVLHNLRAKSLTRNHENFVCATYRKRTKACTAHFIRTVVLEKIVLTDIQSVVAYAKEHAWYNCEHNNNYIFVHEDGKPFHPNRPYQWFKRFIKRHNLPEITFHSLRHPYVKPPLKKFLA
jgi:hypothetical protein